MCAREGLSESEQQVQRLGSTKQHDACREPQVHRGPRTELRADTSPVGAREAVKGSEKWGGD